MDIDEASGSTAARKTMAAIQLWSDFSTVSRGDVFKIFQDDTMQIPRLDFSPLDMTI